MNMQAILLGAILGAIICAISGKLIKGFGATTYANLAIGAWGGLVGVVIGSAFGGAENLTLSYGAAAICSLISLSGVNFLKKYN